MSIEVATDALCVVSIGIGVNWTLWLTVISCVKKPEADSLKCRRSNDAYCVDSSVFVSYYRAVEPRYL